MIIICAAIVLFVSVPLNAVLERVLSVLFAILSPDSAFSNYNTDDAERYVEYKKHEFEVVQSQKSKMLLGARLSKLSTVLDSLPGAQEESELIADQLRRIEDTKTDYPAPAAISRYQLDITIDRPFNTLVDKVADARGQAEQLTKYLLFLKSEKERDALLFKFFLLHNMPAFLRPFAIHAFFHERNILLATEISLMSRRSRQILAFLSTLYALCHFAGILYFVISFALTVGSKAQNLWIIVFWVSVVIDALAVQTLKLFFKWILAVNWQVGKYIRAFGKTLYPKSKLVLIRSSGLLRDFNSLVHHLNPACRVARVLPDLHVSRLLLSLGDHDIAIYKNNHGRGIRYLWISAFFGRIPFWVTDMVGEMTLVLMLFAFFYAIYLLYFVSVFAVVFTPVGLILVIVLIYYSKKITKPIVSFGGRIAALSRSAGGVSSTTIYQDFYDVASVKDEVKDDDSVEMSISTKGSFGSRRNKYKPGAAKNPAVKKLPNPLAPIEEYQEESSGYRGRGSGTVQSKPRPNPAGISPNHSIVPHDTPRSARLNANDEVPTANLKRMNIPLRQARRVARNEQIQSSAGPGSPAGVGKRLSAAAAGPGGSVAESKKMINSATSLSDLLLVSSEGNLPMIDILSRVAAEAPSTALTTSAGGNGPGADSGDIELWASSSRNLGGNVTSNVTNSNNNRYSLYVDDDLPHEQKSGSSPKKQLDHVDENQIFFE